MSSLTFNRRFDKILRLAMLNMGWYSRPFCDINKKCNYNDSHPYDCQKQKCRGCPKHGQISFKFNRENVTYKPEMLQPISVDII